MYRSTVERLRSATRFVLAGLPAVYRLPTILLLAAIPLSVAAQVQYGYDESGRLVQVVSPAGEVVVYVYDAASNVKRVRRMAASSLAIADFTPNRGGVGATVKILGAGFNAVPAANVVKFDGTPAVVSAATPTQLTVSVPPGALSGPIAVTVGGNTVASDDAFSVNAGDGPALTVSGFSPASGGAGTSVAISGAGFDAVAANNLVTLNDRPMLVTSVTGSQIVATVPAGATTGHFRVMTPTGAATALEMFFVPAAADADTSIFARANLAVDGSSYTVTGMPSGKVAMFAFDGLAGQTLDLGVSGLSVSPNGTSGLSVMVFTPNGSTLGICTVYPPGSGGGGCSLATLPKTGTYTIRIAPSQGVTGASTFTATLSTELAGQLAVNAPSATLFSSTRPGQNATYAFSGAQGASYSLVLSGATVPGGVGVSIRSPGGVQLATGSIAQGQSTPAVIDVANLPSSGTYSVLVDPYETSVGQVSLLLTANATGSLTIDGTGSAIALVAGQNARYTFSGNAGQGLSLGIASLTTTPAGGSVKVNVLGPTGALLIACNGGSAYTSSGRCGLPLLPATGIYTVVLDPQGANAASATLLLSTDVVGTLTVDAPAPTTFLANKVGLRSRYAFNGAAGTRYSIVLTNPSFPGASTFQVTVLSPSGGLISSGSVSVSNGGTLDLAAAPVTGVYSVLIEPTGATTGQVSVRVAAEASGSLPIDGGALAVSLANGQNGRYAFNGVLGQKLGLGASSLVTSPSGSYIKIDVYSPLGALLLNCAGTNGTNTPASCNLPPLPQSGSYTVVVDPQRTNSANLSLSLSSDLTGALTVDSATPTVFSTARPGQNGRYTFAGLAGVRYGLAITGVTFPGSSTAVKVFAPNGTQVASGTVAAGGTSAIDIDALPATGTYTVLVDPYQDGTGQLSLAITRNTTGTISIDGAPVMPSLLGAQNGRYAFSGAAGQTLGLGLTSLSTTPAGGALSLKVLAPNGDALASAGPLTTAASWPIPRLPATGSYVLVVDPQGSSAASATLTLSSDINGTLTVDAATPTSFSSTRPGQNGRYQFTGVAGANYVVQPSALTITGGPTMFILYGPDGAVLGSTSGSDIAQPPAITLNNAPASGAYTIVITPYRGNTGSVGLRVTQAGSTPPASQTPNGSLALDGAATAITVPVGQTYRYTFAGTQGQNLGLGWSGFSGSSGTVTITRPDNTTVLVSCPFNASEFSCTLPSLPSTGTFTARVSPSGANLSASLYLSSEQLLSLVANAGSPTVFATTRPGQNGRYTFVGTSGKSYSLVWSGSTFSTTLAPWVRVYGADGVQIGSAQAITAASGVIDLPNIRSDGNYIVTVDPLGSTTGQLGLTLRETVTGSLAVDGASTAMVTSVGQNAQYTFAATAGQYLGLAFESVVTTPAYGTINVTVYDPNGSVHTWCPSVYGGGTSSCNLAPITRSGTYSVLLDPGPQYSASANLTLSTDATGTLAVPPAPAVLFTSTRPGRNGRYTINAVAGERYVATYSGSTLPNLSRLDVYRPDGSLAAGTSIGAGAGALDLGEVAVTGQYQLLVDPAGVGVGQVSIVLRNAYSAALTAGGGAFPVSLAQGQYGRLTFTATAGQAFGLATTSVATVPAGGAIGVKVYDPAGALVVDCQSKTTDNSCNVGPVPITGTYVLALTPPAAASASLSVTLTNDSVATLTTNAAAPLVANIAQPGLNARYSLAFTAGDSATIVFTSPVPSNFPAYFSLYDPNGSLLLSGSTSPMAPGFVVDLDRYGVIQATGNYTLQVEGSGVATGTVSVAVTKSVKGVLIVDEASPTSVQLLTGQTAAYEFTAGSGVNLGVALSGIATAPTPPSANPIVVQLYGPSGTQLAGCSTGAAEAPTCRFPPTKEAGVHTLRILPGSNSASFGIRLLSTR